MKFAVVSILLLFPAVAFADQPLAISERQRVEAIKDAFGLGCAVQDRSTERAFAWASAAMAATSVLESAVSHEAASDFVGVFYLTEKSTRAKGGFNCTGFPAWPPNIAR